MNILDEKNKLRRPFYKLMELSGNELKAKVAGMSREEIINWLEWNDRNGIYSDADSLREFGNVVSKEEGETIMFRQILEG